MTSLLPNLTLVCAPDTVSREEVNVSIAFILIGKEYQLTSN